MGPGIPLLAPSGQASGLFPGRGQGSAGDVMDPELTSADQPIAGALGSVGNSHVHCGALVLGALVGIIVLHLLGFRFAADVSVGR